MNIKQIKLVNNDEIICNVVQWSSAESDEVVIKQALKIVGMDDIETGMRYYTLKPWISLSTDLDQLQIMHVQHVIAVTDPSKTAIDYYNEVIGSKDTLTELVDPSDFELYHDSDNTTLPLIH